MKSFLPVLSHYNDAANREMFAILAGLPAERLNEDVGSYFKSIFAILNHIYGSDCIWLKRMRTVLPHLAALESPLLDLKLAWPTVDLFEELADLRMHRERLDALLEDFTSELTDADLETVIDYKNTKGERHRYFFWQAALHMFNHETHHRGQIAEILDQFGVDNNYSNIVATLSEPPVA